MHQCSQKPSTSLHLSAAIATGASAGDFSLTVILTRTPTSSGSKPSPLSSSGPLQEVWESALHGVTIHPVYTGPTNKWLSVGTQGGIYMQAMGDYLGQVHSDQMVLEMVGQGGWAAWVMANSKSKGTTSPFKSFGSHGSQAGRLDCITMDKDAQRRVRKWL